MSKAYTYADFITESMNYQHSQEYYGFMKEMAEIELMESYLATQQFLAEEAGYYDFTEGVLMEAGDTDSVKTKLSEKAKSLLKKIIEGIKKAWNVFVKFITSIPDKVKGLIDKIKGSKAAESLQFVADSAESDPADTEILFKEFREIISIPNIYESWKIKTLNDPFKGSNYIYDFESIYDAKMFEEFTKLTKALADYINNGDDTIVTVTFGMKPDRNPLDKHVDISDATIYFAVEDIAVKNDGLKDMDKLFDVVKREFTSPPRSKNFVTVSLARFARENDIQKLKDKFTAKMDSLLASANEPVDAEGLKYFGRINKLLSWVFSEYMTASNHAFKLITDIVKVSEKIEEAYEKNKADQNTTES